MCMNSAVTIQTCAGKKKKERKKEGNVKLKTQTRNKPNPNRHLVAKIIFYFLFSLCVGKNEIIFVYNFLKGRVIYFG